MSSEPHSPGVVTFAVPMPGPMAEVKVHLIQLEDGFLLIDTGWDIAESFEALERGLIDRGVAWSDIRTLLVTHLHPDHAGNIDKVLDRSGARFLMHRVDAANLAAIASAGRSPFFDEAWRLAGIPSELQQKLDERMRENRRIIDWREPNWALEGGERINVQGGTLDVVWTPGHSAGHVCLHSTQHRFLIAGDHLLERITPNVGWRPGEDMLAKFLDSLDAVAALDVDWILPSHGSPFQNAPARVAAMRDHHERRCQTILDHLRDSPLTAYDLVQLLFPTRRGRLALNLGVLETLAHLEYLRRRGPVSGEAQRDGSVEWRIT